MWAIAKVNPPRPITSVQTHRHNVAKPKRCYILRSTICSPLPCHRAHRRSHAEFLTLQLKEQRATQDSGRSAVRCRRSNRSEERKSRAASNELNRLPGHHRSGSAAERGSPSQARPRPPPGEEMLPHTPEPGARGARSPGGRGGGEDTGLVSRLPSSSPTPPLTPTADAHSGGV